MAAQRAPAPGRRVVVRGQRYERARDHRGGARGNARRPGDEAPGGPVSGGSVSGGVVPLVVSARSAASLAGQAGRLAAYLRRAGEVPLAEVPLAQVAGALVSGRAALPERAVVLAGSPDEAVAGLDALARGEAAAGVVTGRAGTARAGAGQDRVGVPRPGHAVGRDGPGAAGLIPGVRGADRASARRHWSPGSTGR